MNAEMQVLQSLDAAQDALRRLPFLDATARAGLAQTTLQQVANAPWAMVTRNEEAEQHGWLTELRETLEQIALDPDAADVPKWAEQGLWAANELERDLRQLLRAR